MKRAIVLAGAALALAGCATTPSGSEGTAPAAPVAAAETDAAPTTPPHHEPIDLIPSATGAHSWTITTSSPEAQDYFNQGMQLRWAYNMGEAARSMAQARRIDPSCAMCFWGEAFALGSFLNGAMNEERAVHAHAAITRAVELADGTTDLERALIEAAQVRYPADFDAETQRANDEDFAAQMAEVYARYPDNHDVATVYAVSLFLLEDRLGHRDNTDPDVVRLHGVLTGVLDENIKHPGACHLYIHATESTQDPGQALDCAEHLSDAIPAASHVQHMPSHTWNEVGMWNRSVRAGQLASRSDQMAQGKQGFSYGAAHNLHMMLFAASMDGQGAVAMQAGRDFTRVTDGNTLHELLTLFRFGRFEEILDVADAPPGEVGGGFWDFAHGYARLRTGDVAAARAHLAKVQGLAANSEATLSYHKASQLMGLAANILEGEILREEGNLPAAIAAFERAAEFDDQQAYAEPEPIPFAARHWLGAALIEAGQPAEAEKVYRTELADHPHNVWSLQGLVTALAAQDKSDPAVEEDYKASTARADFWLSASRF